MIRTGLLNIFYKYGMIIRKQSPFKRRLILISIDIISIIFALFLSISFFNNNYIFYTKNWFLFSMAISVFGIFINVLSGQYRGISRYISEKLIVRFFFSNLFLSSNIFVYKKLINLNYISFKTLFLFTITLTFLNVFIRALIRNIIERNVKFNKKSNSKNIVIYGAGDAGAQLAASLIISNKYNLKFFVDDNYDLKGRHIYEIPIYSSKYLFKEAKNIDQIFLAIPSLTIKERYTLINKISELSIPILKVPSIDELAKGTVTIADLRPISVEELIGRERIEPLKELFGPSIKGNVIFISGAAGSIGEELCMQLLSLKPKELIIFDISEASLYKAYENLKNANYQDVKLTPILGCATNFKLIFKVFKECKVNIVFHAAAYKHVPLVEINPIEGIRNNIFATQSICEAAKKVQFIKKVILISSDKAVRPTNIMGASKRVSELIIQGYGEEINKEDNFKVFSMVRFGNVIGSSGSVLPLFKKQINKGGPLTVTHKDIYRFFMTIEEAAQLVIQASQIAKGNEVFLLDMGEQVKITEVAKQLIRINGLSVKDKNNPSGDIEIKYIGLRPGEKLREELLIDSESKSTKHPLIYYAKESSIPLDKLLIELKYLNSYCLEQELNKVLDSIKKLVPEWEKSNEAKI